MAIKNFILCVHLNNHISSKVNYGKDYLRFLIEERISKELVNLEIGSLIFTVNYIISMECQGSPHFKIIFLTCVPFFSKNVYPQKNLPIQQDTFMLPFPQQIYILKQEINDYNNNNIFYTYSGPIILVKYSCRNGNTVVWYAAVVEDLAKHISWAKTGSCSKFCTLRRKLFFFFSSAALLLRGFIDSTKGLLVDSQSIRPKTCSCCCC